MFNFGKRRLICPYCLTEIRSRNIPNLCLRCKNRLPVQYVQDYDENPPFFAQVLGWSQVGKTVFQSALTLMLVKMSKVWPRYSYSAATEESQKKVQDINEYIAKGKMPRRTAPGDEEELYIMLLRNMERWGGRTLVTRDCPGEFFDQMEIPIDKAPFLLNAPTTFMLVSLHDLPNSGGKSMEMLLNNYINTLMKYGVNFKKEQRKLVVVFTKADLLIDDLPSNLLNYLIEDPLWSAISTRGHVKQMDTTAMQEYLEVMERVSRAISEWIQEEASGKAFVQLARDKNIDIRFSLISSTGSEVSPTGATLEELAPRRVMDPYFWALELQSRT